MNLSGGPGESMRPEFGLQEAVAAPFGPSDLARTDVGVGDTILERGGEAGILGHPARDLRHIWGESAEMSEHFDERPCSGEKGGEVVRAGHP